MGLKVRHSPEGLIRLPYLLQCEGNFVVLHHSGPGLILCLVEREKARKTSIYRTNLLRGFEPRTHGFQPGFYTVEPQMSR
jgi:hypothetical protein